jgi:hypothetical protein
LGLGQTMLGLRDDAKQSAYLRVRTALGSSKLAGLFFAPPTLAVAHLGASGPSLIDEVPSLLRASTSAHQNNERRFGRAAYYALTIKFPTEV